MLQASIKSPLRITDRDLPNDDVFRLADIACTDNSEYMRASARYDLGTAIAKNPRIAGAIIREMLELRERTQGLKHTVHAMLMTVVENSLGQESHYPTVAKFVETACFNDNRLNRAVAGWAILRNLESALAS